MEDELISEFLKAVCIFKKSRSKLKEELGKAMVLRDFDALGGSCKVKGMHMSVIKSDIKKYWNINFALLGCKVKISLMLVV